MKPMENYCNNCGKLRISMEAECNCKMTCNKYHYIFLDETNEIKKNILNKIITNRNKQSANKHLFILTSTR